MLLSIFAPFFVASLTALTPGTPNGHTVALVTGAASATRPGDQIEIQRIAAAVETRLGLRETVQQEWPWATARTNVCAPGVDYDLWIDAGVLTELSSTQRLSPRLTVTLTRCADRSVVSASRSSEILGTRRLDDPRIAQAYRALEPLLIDEIVSKTLN